VKGRRGGEIEGRGEGDERYEGRGEKWRDRVKGRRGWEIEGRRRKKWRDRVRGRRGWEIEGEQGRRGGRVSRCDEKRPSE
jgi:hypothetical protein